MRVDVLSGGVCVARGVVFSGSTFFSPMLWRLCDVCVGAGVGGWRAIGRDGGVMSGQ